MSNTGTFLYFGYGSNMPQKRIKPRCPSAEFVGLGRLKDYALKWNKLSKDDSAKCNIEKAEGETVWGAVYKIPCGERTALQKAEGLGKSENGYQEEEHEIAVKDGKKEAVVYIAYPKEREEGWQPYDWYHTHVLNGARECGLPQDYIKNKIETAQVKPDDDIKRRIRELAIYL